jgi:hypothetical protein
MTMRAAAVAGLLVLGACASSNTPTFRTDAAPGFSPAGWQTYSWAFQSAPPGANTVQFQRIQDAFDTAFAARGFRKVPDGGDFIVGFTVGARDRVDVTNWGSVGPMYPGWGRPGAWGWSHTYNRVDVRNVTQGQLALDIFDGNTKRPVWHGFASRDLSSSGASPELIANAVNGLVDRFKGTTTTR